MFLDPPLLDKIYKFIKNLPDIIFSWIKYNWINNQFPKQSPDQGQHALKFSKALKHLQKGFITLSSEIELY